MILSTAADISCCRDVINHKGSLLFLMHRWHFQCFNSEPGSYTTFVAQVCLHTSPPLLFISIWEEEVWQMELHAEISHIRDTSPFGAPFLYRIFPRQNTISCQMPGRYMQYNPFRVTAKAEIQHQNLNLTGVTSELARAHFFPPHPSAPSERWSCKCYYVLVSKNSPLESEFWLPSSGAAKPVFWQTN